MRILALETATEGCSAALYLDGEISTRFELAPRRHTELILPMAETLLRDAGIAAGALDAIAFGRGPGSFTGVRIATAVAQGLAFGAELPLLPISTLASLAQGMAAEVQAQDDESGGEHDAILAVIDARMNEVYAGQFRVDAQGVVEPLADEMLRAPDDLPRLAAGRWWGAGSGFGTYGDRLRERLGDRLHLTRPDALPHAADTARLAARAWEQGMAVSPEQALPVYLRDNVAALPSS